MDEQFPGVFRDDGYFTENLVPGERVYGEALVEQDGVEYRRWDPHRSKAAAALTKGLRDFPLDRDDAVLYLGASTGTTVSHVSDIVTGGAVYAVEHAPAVARQLLEAMEDRGNVAPVLGDARTPEDYAALVPRVDVIYQDVAQRDQVRILKANADAYLREGGHAMIAIKAQSIASSPPEEVFADAKEALRDRFDVVHGVKLAPFHEDHLFLLLRA